MSKTLKQGKVLGMKTPEDDAALDEVRRQLSNMVGYGTGAPDADTVGNIYVKLGASTSDTLTLYLRHPDTKAWWGG